MTRIMTLIIITATVLIIDVALVGSTIHTASNWSSIVPWGLSGYNNNNYKEKRIRK